MKDTFKNKILNFTNTLNIRPSHTLSISLTKNTDTNIFLFGLSKDTNISEEFYDNNKLYINISGKIMIDNEELKKYDSILFFNSSYAIKAIENSHLIEITFDEEEDMINIDKKGEIFNLKDCIEYIDGGIANFDLVSRDDLKIVLMAFDENEGLSPHSAPGDALILALEGEAEVMVENKVSKIKEGEQIIFPKDKIHNVTALSKFKMALILVK